MVCEDLWLKSMYYEVGRETSDTCGQDVDGVFHLGEVLHPFGRIVATKYS